MKKILIYIFLITVGVQSLSSQQCGFDEARNIFTKSDGNYNENIKKEVVKLLNNRLTSTSITNDQVITIPVVYNLIYPFNNFIGQGANIHGSVLQNKINELNQKFGGLLGGVNIKIRFCLAQKNIYGFKEIGIKRYYGKSIYQPFIRGSDQQVEDNLFKVDNEIKSFKSNGFPLDSFLNIWVVDLIDVNGNQGLYGYSSNPLGGPKLKSGVVVDYSTFNRSVLTHEIGHWMGLLHVFESSKNPNNLPCNEQSCETQGDMVCDTEPVRETGYTNIAPGNCKGYNCKGQITSVVQNFMDYQREDRDYCRIGFTEGQKLRMRETLEDHMSVIYKNSVYNLNDYCTPPIGTGGIGVPSPFELKCRNCYKPNFILPDDFKSTNSGVRKFVNGANRSLYVFAASFANNLSKVYFYKKDCSKLEINYELQLPTNYRPKEIKVVDDSTVLLNNWGNNTTSTIYVIKKKNGKWYISNTLYRPKEYRGQFFDSSQGTLLVTNDRNSSLFKIERFDGFSFQHIKSFVHGYKAPDSSGYTIYNSFASGRFVFIGRSREDFEIWKLNDSNSYDYQGNIQIKLKGNWEESGVPSKGYIKSITANGGYVVAIEYRRTKHPNNLVYEEKEYVRVYKIKKNRYESIGELGLDVSGFHKLNFLNDSYVAMRSEGYRELRTHFLKIDKKLNTFQLYNLNHLNPNSIKKIDFLCSSTFSLNYREKEIILDNSILKLADLFNVKNSKFELISEDVSKRTFCANKVMNDEFVGYDITIKPEGNCHGNIEVINQQVRAVHQIVIKPNTKIKGKRFVASIESNLGVNNCVYNGNCSSREFVKSRDEKELKEEKESDSILGENDGILFYPNPNKGIFHIRNPERVFSLDVFDLKGNRLFTVSGLIPEVIETDLERGVYLLKIKTKENKECVKRLIISK